MLLVQSSRAAPAQKHMHRVNLASSQQQGSFKLTNVSNDMLRCCQCFRVRLRGKLQPVLSRSLFFSVAQKLTLVCSGRGRDQAYKWWMSLCPSACPKPRWHNQVEPVEVFLLHGESLYVTHQELLCTWQEEREDPCAHDSFILQIPPLHLTVLITQFFLFSSWKYFLFFF